MAKKAKRGETTFNQKGQTVHGPQTNIGGDATAPVFSGSFAGPVQVGDTNVGDIIGSTGVAVGPGASVQVGAPADEIGRAFAAIMEKVNAVEDKEARQEAAEALQKLEVEARKGEGADEARARRWFSFLAEAAPDAWEVAVNTFLNPIAGVATVFKKIAERAKAEREKK